MRSERFHRAKPHLFPVGSRFMHMKFRCCRCRREMSSEGFSPIHNLDATVRYKGMPHAVLLHPMCKRCRTEIKSRVYDHPKFTSGLHEYFSRLLSSTRGGATTRSILVHIDVDDVLELYFDQDGKCAMSGVEMMVQRKAPRFKDPLAASIDRIDSDGRYERTNIQLVCARVNVMKGDMHHNDMIDWCKRILANQMAKEGELLKLVS